MLTTKWIKACLSMAVFAAMGSVHAAPGELRIGTEGGYPPWSMTDAAGKVTGFDADVGAELCKDLKLKCKFVVQAFDSLIPSLDTGRFDIVISGMSVTDERAKKIDFSVPYAAENNYFIVPKGSNLATAADIKTLLAGLANKNVGVQGGTTHGSYLKKHAPNIKIKPYDSLDQMQIDLDAGRLDATFADSASQQEFLKKSTSNKFALAKTFVPSSDDASSFGVGIGVGIKKGNTDLKKQVNASLCKMIKDGTIKKLSVKWFNEDLTNQHAECPAK